MSPITEQRLALLVDREEEIANFCRMLDDVNWMRPIMAISGEGGMGKSSLLFRMMHECSLRKFTKAEIYWTDIYNHDYLGVMRKIRDDVGATRFSNFTALVNYFYADQPIRVEVRVESQGSLAVGEGVTLAPNAQIRQMAGVVFEPGSIVIKDHMETTPRRDLAISDLDRMARLTDEFVRELDAAAAQTRLVVFFDAVEKATEPTRRWLWGGLFEALQQNRLRNTQFVVCGRNRPEIDDRWRQFVDEERLGPLKQQHIGDFLERLHIELPDAERKRVVDTIWVASQGNPLKIANYAGELSRMWKTQN